MKNKKNQIYETLKRIKIIKKNNKFNIKNINIY